MYPRPWPFYNSLLKTTSPIKTPDWYNGCMEVKDIVTFLKKNYLHILLTGLILSSACAVLYYAIPATYDATGSFFIKRGVDSNSTGDYFTYEGYYSQQTALSYTNTLTGIFESEDIKSKALMDLGTEVNEWSIRKLGRNMRIKKSGPQLITLTVKGNTPQSARSTWLAITKATITTANFLNTNGDSKLTISQLNENPVVKMSFRNLYVNILVGFGMGILLSIGIRGKSGKWF